jgi:hypothetical protein
MSLRKITATMNSAQMTRPAAAARTKLDTPTPHPSKTLVYYGTLLCDGQSQVGAGFT